MGNCRKYPYHRSRTAFRNSEGKGGGSLNWKSEGMGDTYDWNSKGMGGGLDLGFPRRQTRVHSLKMLILWTFKVSSQIKHELTTLLTNTEAGYKTSIDRSDMCSCSFAEENQQNVGCTSSSRGL